MKIIILDTWIHISCNRFWYRFFTSLKWHETYLNGKLWMNQKYRQIVLYRHNLIYSEKQFFNLQIKKYIRLKYISLVTISVLWLIVLSNLLIGAKSRLFKNELCKILIYNKKTLKNIWSSKKILIGTRISG